MVRPSKFGSAHKIAGFGLKCGCLFAQACRFLQVLNTCGGFLQKAVSSKVLVATRLAFVNAHACRAHKEKGSTSHILLNAHKDQHLMPLEDSKITYHFYCTIVMKSAFQVCCHFHSNNFNSLTL